MQILQIIYAKQSSIQTLAQIVTASSLPLDPAISHFKEFDLVFFVRNITFQLSLSNSTRIGQNSFSRRKDVVETSIRSLVNGAESVVEVKER